MSLAETAQSINQAISNELNSRFNGWTVNHWLRDQTGYYSRLKPYCVWTSTFTRNKVSGSVRVVWTQNGKNAYILKANWTFNPTSFTTRAHRADFIIVTQEMSNNAPFVEQLMRAEIANMGDPIEVLAKKARKSKTSSA